MLDTKGVILKMKGVNYEDCLNLKKVFDEVTFYDINENPIMDISESMRNIDLLILIGVSSYNKNFDLTFEEFVQPFCEKIVEISGDADFQIREFSCANLTNLKIFDLKNVEITTASYLFFNCYSLVKVGELNTSKAKDMVSMFAGCKSLTEVPMFDTKEVVNMEAMFGNCYSLKTVPLFDTRKVRNMTRMFYSCRSLESIPEFNTLMAKDMTQMFSKCIKLKTIPELDVQEVRSMAGMFSGCISFEELPYLETDNVANINFMFQNCKSLKAKPNIRSLKDADIIITDASEGNEVFDKDEDELEMLKIVTMIDTFEGTKFEEPFND